MALPDEQRTRLDAIVQRMTADGQPPDAIRAVVSDFTTKYAAPEKERTWGDTFTDALPLAGGVVGGVVGAAGGIPGMMAGSAIGGGFGEAARQRLTQDDYDFGDIATTAIGEGATAGAFGAAGKIGSRVIRGVRRSGVKPMDVIEGVAKAPFTHGPIGAVKRSINDTTAARVSRESLGSGRLAGRVEKLDDVLLQAMDDARANPAPTRVGGSGTPLRSKSNLPVVNAERAGDMISTQPDKWGATSIHQADDFVDRSRLVDKARPVTTPPQAPAAQASMRSDAFSRNMGGDPQRQQLVRELMKTQDALIGREAGAPLQSAGPLSKSGRSMLTPDEEAKLLRALGMQQ